jgi:L-threonate 2-dehydrogenase
MGQRIGVIGLGQIGLPLAKLLLEAGHEVVGYRRGDMRELRQAGGQSADSPREIAESAEIILSCLPSSAALDQVVDGQDGLLAARRPILLIELSTLSPAHRLAVRDRLARVRGEMLDCPMSGTPVMLASRNSVIFASGERSAFVRALPVLQDITPKVFFLGEFGVGTRLKFCANLLVGVHIMAAAEAISLGQAAGLDGELLVSALRDSAATSLQFQGSHDGHGLRGAAARAPEDARQGSQAHRVIRWRTRLRHTTAQDDGGVVREGNVCWSWRARRSGDYTHPQ